MLDSQPCPIAAPDTSQNLPLQPHVNGNLNGIMTPGHDPFSIKPRPLNGLYGDAGLIAEANGTLDWETPANGSQVEDDVTMEDISVDPEAPHAPGRKPRHPYAFQQETGSDIPKMRSITTRSKAKAGPDTMDPSEHLIKPTAIPMSHAHKRTVSGQAAGTSTSGTMDPPGAPQRRSDRLLRNRILPGKQRLAAAASRETETFEKREIRRVKTTTMKGKSMSTVGRVVSGNRKPLEPSDRDAKEGRPASVASTTGSIKEMSRKMTSAPPDVSLPKEALAFLIGQYEQLGQGHLALAKFECQEALHCFETMLPCFRETPWVLAQMGRAHFEKSAYADGESVFAKIRKMAPSRTEDMEIYSTVLWHLKKDVDLSYLSHELMETDRLSPQAWSALGNAFSLQGEHDQAVKCFRRATQLDPKFAYAFTLAGHEHVANEEFEKALLAFRNAIAADSRHYNGWYGLGQVFEKLGKYEIAREHYVNAAKVNPTNPLLKVAIGLVLEKTCVGLVPEKTRRREMALEMYKDACELDPSSAKARFAKARVLLILHRAKESYLELNELKSMVPDDCNVHFLLGRVYKALNDRSSALRHFTIAMNLDPKVSRFCDLKDVGFFSLFFC
jgi:anaphase-promoting complex subunit 3